MNNWTASLHLSFSDEPVLLSFIRLRSFLDFLVACVLTVSVCLVERGITFALERRWQPHFARRSRWRVALWRAASYWMATFLRLSYMLIAMTFHLGLIIIAVTTLATAQFFVELHNHTHSQGDEEYHDRNGVSEPLLRDHSFPMESVGSHRPRSKSKPLEIFIHPSQSNIARADALEHALNAPQDTRPGWKAGEGREVARALAQSAQKGSYSHSSGDDEEDSGSDDESDSFLPSK